MDPEKTEGGDDAGREERPGRKDGRAPRRSGIGSLFRGKSLIFILGPGNFLFWCFFTFIILCGCAWGQTPYKLAPLKSGSYSAHPVLWWFNYIHTCTLAVSVPLIFVTIALWARGEGDDGVGEIHRRMRRKNLRRKKKVKCGEDDWTPTEKNIPKGDRSMWRKIVKGFPRTSMSRWLGGH
jgi:hypothetical protein